MHLRDSYHDALDHGDVYFLREVLGDWGNGESCPMSAVYYDYLFHDDDERRHAWSGPRPAWLVRHALAALTIYTEAEKPRVARALELLDKVATHESIIAKFDAAVKAAHEAGIGYQTIQRLAVQAADRLSADWNYG